MIISIARLRRSRNDEAEESIKRSPARDEDTTRDERTMLDERDGAALMRSMAAGALSGGLSFVRLRVGDAEFARVMSRVRIREPIARLVGPPVAHEDVIAERPPLPLPERVANDQRSPSNEPATPSRFLDEKQLCAELDISSVTATKWRRNTEGPPFVRVGRLIRYPRESVDAWLASRTVGVPRPPKQ